VVSASLFLEQFLKGRGEVERLWKSVVLFCKVKCSLPSDGT